MLAANQSDPAAVSTAVISIPLRSALSRDIDGIVAANGWERGATCFRPLWRRGNQRCFGSSVPTWTLRRDGLGVSTACLVFRLDAFGLRISKSCLHDVDLVS